MKREEHIEGFVREMWHWYARHKRSLPWRDMSIEDDADRAYRVLVSEVMLQQTQVSRVIPIFKQFLETFPTLQALGSANNKSVIVAWRGMGYNSRALRLRDAAKTITEDFAGVFPSDMDSLTSIKGIGHYTAGAIRNFAFNIETPCIDVNIRRILHRVFVGPERIDGTWEKSDKELLPLAKEILHVALDPARHPELVEGRHASASMLRQAQHDVGDIPHDTRNWHAALMDFGSMVCTKNAPKWDLCPLTAKGLMKAAYKVPTKKQRTENGKQEPGRVMGARFIPNRIFRGRIVESLRDARAGLTMEQIGREICSDWAAEHREWLQSLLKKLISDELLSLHEKKFVLKE